jgi:hypothetical protein
VCRGESLILETMMRLDRDTNRRDLELYLKTDQIQETLADVQKRLGEVEHVVLGTLDKFESRSSELDSQAWLAARNDLVQMWLATHSARELAETETQAAALIGTKAWENAHADTRADLTLSVELSRRQGRARMASLALCLPLEREFGRALERAGEEVRGLRGLADHIEAAIRSSKPQLERIGLELGHTSLRQLRNAAAHGGVWLDADGAQVSAVILGTPDKHGFLGRLLVFRAD